MYSISDITPISLCCNERKGIKSVGETDKGTVSTLKKGGSRRDIAYDLSNK
jgi:hypothetical protein